MSDPSPHKLQNHLTRVLRVRIKDKHAAELREAAYWVNQVWNYTNELSFKILQREGRFAGAYELQKFTDGATKEGLPLHSQTVQAIVAEYATRRWQFKRAKLRWRVSGGSRRSLGWVPYKASAIRYRNGQLHVSGLRRPLSLWDSYDLSKYKLGVTTLSEDARGRWYANITVRIAKPQRQLADVCESALGIDLGLKSLVADSEGGKVEAQRFYRDLQNKLAVAQRAGRKARVRAIHAKIAHRRKDFLLKLSTQQVRTHQAIFVGDVEPSRLAKTRMAKSVLDAGWSAYRTMLQYKCDDAGVWFRKVNESYSTQECSACGKRHDRDTNSALVIRNRGLKWLESEISSAAVPAQSTSRHAQAESKRTAHTAALAVGRGRPAVGISVL
jgi:IS605 OrfB family transposase